MKQVSGMLECVFMSDDGKKCAATLRIKDFDLDVQAPYPSWATPEQWSAAAKMLSDILIKEIREQA